VSKESEARGMRSQEVRIWFEPFGQMDGFPVESLQRFCCEAIPYEAPEEDSA
jgi:hypothetical protein